MDNLTHLDEKVGCKEEKNYNSQIKLLNLIKFENFNSYVDCSDDFLN